jgi:hypothetical protein
MIGNASKRGDSEEIFDPEALVRRVEEILLMDESSEEQKIEILRKLLAIVEEN